MRELLVATRNKNKVSEIASILSGLDLKLLTLDEAGLPPDYSVEEPGTTYEVHAAIKAILYGKKAGVLALADDSGLEVDALDGWPGVHSATWREGSDVDRLEGLLQKMADIPSELRGARFRSVIAIFDPVNEKLRFVEGICRGRLLRERKGRGGFGYDPIFFSDDLHQTFGEVTDEEKNTVSHRARALAAARHILVSEFI